LVLHINRTRNLVRGSVLRPKFFYLKNPGFFFSGGTNEKKFIAKKKKGTTNTTRRLEDRKLHTQPKEKLTITKKSSFGFENQTWFRSSSYSQGPDLTV
jgi:hypothetical protein